MICAGQEIVYRDYVDIGVAVASPGGLLVPILRDCQHMNWATTPRNHAAQPNIKTQIPCFALILAR